MNEVVAETLKKLIEEYGLALSNNRIKLQGLLMDLCGENRKEIKLLITALQENVVLNLENYNDKIEEDVFFRIVNNLCDEAGIIKEGAQWTVETWANALGKEVIRTNKEEYSVHNSSELKSSYNINMKSNQANQSSYSNNQVIQNENLYNNNKFTNKVLIGMASVAIIFMFIIGVMLLNNGRKENTQTASSSTVNNPGSSKEQTKQNGNEENTQTVSSSTTNNSGSSKEQTKQNDNEKNSSNLSNNQNGFIFPNSANTLITKQELTSLTKEKLAIARNEIYARHGYVFITQPYKDYFNTKSWYTPNPSFKGEDTELNEIEKNNVYLIKSME